MNGAHGGDIYSHKADLDFSVNLNPFPVPGSIYDALNEGIKHSREYPDIKQRAVRKALAEADETDIDSILAGNGASELIPVVINALRPSKAVLIRPCFSGYERALKLHKGCTVTDICMKENNDYMMEDDITGQIPDDADILCIADPISHTGHNISDEVLRDIIGYCDTRGIKVILDESFFFLSEKARNGKSGISRLMEEYKGLYIIRSFTKLFALPGIRMGYLLSSEDNIKEIEPFLPEWNLSQPAAYCMAECARIIKEENFIKRSAEYIGTERGFLKEALERQGIRVFGSDTLYLCIKTGECCYPALLDKGILIRNLADEKPFGKGYFRIAVRDRSENEIFLDNLNKVIPTFGGSETSDIMLRSI